MRRLGDKRAFVNDMEIRVGWHQILILSHLRVFKSPHLLLGRKKEEKVFAKMTPRKNFRNSEHFHSWKCVLRIPK